MPPLYSTSMYELRVESEFAAAHAISIHGSVEALHGHNWHVVVGVIGESLDGDGLLCDFHLVESHLRDVVGVFHNGNLNDTPPFTDTNPTAENVARHIAEALHTRLRPHVPSHVRIAWASVTEAPGCTAIYRMPMTS